MEPCFHKDSNILLEDEDKVSPVGFLTPTDIRQSPAAPEDEKLHHSSSDHSSDEDECKEEDKDEDEHEDFEETLIQPRALNEVTSVTDRTSPWTSLLSDPDMGSLESLELLHDDTIHTRGEERNGRELVPAINPQSLTAESQGIDSDSDICEGSETDLDTFRSERAIATDHRQQQPSPDGLDGDGALSSISEVDDYDLSKSGPEEKDEKPNSHPSTESGSETDDKSVERRTKPYPSKL